MADQVLNSLRKICMALPEAEEVETWGHPNFRVANKIFTIYHGHPGDEGICFKVGKHMMGVYLADPRFYRTPHLAHHGWVSLRVHAAKVNLEELDGLVRISYRNIAPKRVGRLVGAE